MSNPDDDKHYNITVAQWVEIAKAISVLPKIQDQILKTNKEIAKIREFQTQELKDIREEVQQNRTSIKQFGDVIQDHFKYDHEKNGETIDRKPGSWVDDPFIRRGVVISVIIFLLLLLVVVGGREILKDVPQVINGA